MKPYYEDDLVTLYHGDCREVLPSLAGAVRLSGEGRTLADLIVTDPPYGETSLAWDQWPEGWPALAAVAADSMWCFGTMRMFLNQRDEFAAWRMSQDVIWEKQTGSSFATDRLMRVHEHALHFYQGAWSDIHHEAPRVGHRGPDKSVQRRAVGKGHHGERGASTYVDDGRRQLRSVIYAPNMHGKSLHPTEKPPSLLEHLITYGCLEGGTVLDLFAGSSSTLAAAKATGRRAIGIEGDERYCEVSARRLAQDTLFGGVA
jgi:site-specific DNA-methyltransferase (adenine-specific)